MANHTPGPWSIGQTVYWAANPHAKNEARRPYSYWVSSPSIVGFGSAMSVEVRENGRGNSDALLIAAAPSMYEALKGLLAGIESIEQCIDHVDCTRDKGAKYYASLDAAKSALSLASPEKNT